MLKAYLLFPAIERLTESENGSRTKHFPKGILKYFVSCWYGLLASLPEYLKRYIAFKVISQDLKDNQHDIGNIVEAALHWVGFRNFLGMMSMTYGEYRDIKKL